MANPSTVRIARMCAIGVVTVLLFVGIGILYAGWPPFVGDPNVSLSGTGYAAMALALLAVAAFGLGIALLVHHDKHHR